MTISIAANKILSFYTDAQKLRRGEMIIPRMVSLWLTTGCDLDCIYCWCHKENRQFKLADTSSVKQMIDEIAALGVESLELGGGGEPTLHPDCFEIAEHAHVRGLKVGLLTNGFRFDLKHISCFQYVRIGLDAYNADLYHKIKGGSPGRFEETIKVIHAMLRERGKAARPRIGIKYLLCRDNWRYVEDMAALARDLHVDYCQFKPVHSCDVVLSGDFPGIVEREILRVGTKEPGFVYGTALPCIKTVRCFLSPTHAVITPDGDALVCCFFNRPDKVIGNVFREGFAEIWHSKRHWYAIDAIPEEECGKYDCRWHYYNAEMAAVLDGGKYDLSFI